MDALDFAILGHLFADPRAHYDQLGERASLSANAVKARIKRLEDEGVLRGFHATPRSHLLGLRDGLLVFQSVDDVEEREEELLRNLPDVPGVVYADVGVDRSVLVWVAYRDDEDWERLERAAVSLVGKPPSEGIRAAPAEPPARLAPADWRLVQALVGDGRASLRDLTARSSLSPKTARKRLEALQKAGHLRLEPVLSPAEAHGLAVFSLLVQLHEDTPDDKALRAHLPADAIVTRPGPERVRLVHAHRASLREAHQDLLRVRACPDVVRASLHLPTRRHGVSWFSDLAALRLQEARQPTAPLPPPVPLPVPAKGRG